MLQMRMSLAIVTVLSLCLALSERLWAVTWTEMVQDVETYRALMATKGTNTMVKYLIQKPSETPRTLFQNTTQYPYHLPFLKAEIPQYQGLTANDYELLLFHPDKKALSAGEIFYIKTWATEGISSPGFIAFTVYQRAATEIEEIVNVHTVLKSRVPLANQKLAYVFEDTNEFLKNKMKLQQRGIPSLLKSVLTKKGNLLEPSPSPSPVPSPSPNPQPSPSPVPSSPPIPSIGPSPSINGTYTYTHTNHGWNGWELQTPTQTLRVLTPMDDAPGDHKNLGPGFRPKLRFNKVEMLTTDGQKLGGAAVWPSQALPYGDVFCKTLSGLVEITEQTVFPIPAKDLGSQFGLPNATAESTCGIQVSRPTKRPSPWGLIPTGDMLCMANLNVDGANYGVTIYAPFAYFQEPLGPYLDEWPIQNIQICLGGRIGTLKEKK